MRILVVDDEPLVLDTIAPFLARCGHEVLCRSSVAEAKSAIGNRDGAVDLVITDVCMPGRDGAQLLHQVRLLFPDIDVMLMTAHSQIGDLREAVEQGAAGFLRKPVKLNELRLLVEQVAANRADRTRIHRLAASLDAERGLRETMTRERMFARRLHQRIFPSDFSWLRHTEVAMRHLPQAGLGGDYMDIRPYGPGAALLLVADVSGHGTPAAFGGIALKTWFSSVEAGLSPVDVLARADAMMRELFPDEYYATAFCARYDEQSRELVYASAGHPAPLLWSPRGGHRALEVAGGALGLAGGAERGLASAVLGEDEVLIAYTDGLSDDLAALAEAGGRACGECRRGAGLDLKDLLTRTLDLATTAAPLHAFSDDISLLALRPRPASRAGGDAALAGRRVLHIEDDPVMREVVAQTLRIRGLEASEWDRATGAHEAIQSTAPDLVILDLVLPDGLGHVLFRELRHRHPHLPVLVVTGNDVDHAARQCFDLNPAGILTKPVDLRELDRAVVNALQFDPDRDLVAFDNLGNEWFDFVISSSPVAVELLTRYLQALGRQPIPEEVLDDVVWCIREMAMNGIEWGNRFAPGLEVRVSTLIMPGRIMVKIADQGSGFDTHRLFESFDPLSASEERDRLGKRCGGFGLTMVQLKMTRVEFNQRGNVVLLVKEYSA
jgi:sigma-B regulation protein RsbU (phosphoserine phosphatase)